MSVQQQLQRLQSHLPKFEDVLDHDEFYAKELDVETEKAQTVINLLRETGAIEKKGWERNGTSKRFKWGWINHRDQLKEYLEEQDSLPCDCRAHVPAEQDGETYYCKFCGQGHSRDVIKEAL